MKTIERMAEVDVRLFEMRKKQRQYPRMLEEKRRQLDAEQLILNELTGPWEALENQIGQKEATIQVALDTIEKFEEHMKQVTTQKEFLAAKKQVEEARKINTQLQNEILEARMKQDELSPRLQEVRVRYNNVLETYQEEEGRLLKELEQMEKETAEEESRLKVLSEEIGKHLFSDYLRLVRGGKLPAIVPVISGTCGGCRMTIPPQSFNLLIAKPDDLHTCSHCNRIVYFCAPSAPEEEVPAEEVPTEEVPTKGEKPEQSAAATGS